MGRPRKTSQTLEGNLTVQQKLRRELQEKLIQAGAEQLVKPPKWLRDRVAKSEWKRLVKEFAQLEVISNLDLNNLGAYCNAYSGYIQVTKELKDEPLTVEHTNKFGATNTIENPLIKLQIKYTDEMRKFSSMLGLTIDSRLKIAALKFNEKENEITKKFGDI